MSDSETTPVPRRSQREKKAAKQFSSIDTPSKRKRTDSDTEAQEPGEDEDDDAGDADEEEEEEEEEEYRAPKASSTKAKRPVAARKPKAKAGATGGPPPAKKPRMAKAAIAAGKKNPRKPRKAKENADAFDAAKVAKDTKITADNPLFNAVMNPAAALQSTAEDFLESLDQSPGPAQAELINLVLRSCGCNDSVDGDEVLDYDGIVDALDNFTEALKKDDSPIYPLTSKLPIFKKFRKSLSEFVERLVSSAADLGSLYSSDLMATLQAWVVAMSSSQIRSFRHTATVIALEVETALCDVASAVEKEAEVLSRQQEGDRKRQAANKKAGGGVRAKELETKAEEVRNRRTLLAEFIKEFVDGVFVHRYRDLDPAIRAECVRSIGIWFKKYPAHFLDTTYLRYIGWVLSDVSTPVRLEAVRALAGVYDQVDYIGSLNQFTERFKPRLIEMARQDTELSVRTAVIEVLGAIDGHGLLGDEERETLCLLVFDKEVKVRKAVGAFVRGVWEDAVEERTVGKELGKNDRAHAGVKSVAALLISWGKALDHKDKNDDQGDDTPTDDSQTDDDDPTNSKNQRRLRKEVPALVTDASASRIALAVEALWDQVEPVSDWEGLLEVLLLDHSAAGEDEDEGSSGGSTPSRRVTAVVDEAWRLEEVEEGAVLEILVTALRTAKREAAGSKKDDDETVTNDITRALIKGLPRLFVKHQSDESRIATVLLIPPLMNMDLYLEMRMMTSYASLWDDVTKQFMSHSSTAVLVRAVTAIRYFIESTSVSNTNSTKILELEDELSIALRDAVADRDEIEVATFTEDEVRKLESLCARLFNLAGVRDISSWIDEDEGGKQSSAWDIINAIIERGRLGYKEEESMIEQAVQLLTFHIIWKLQGLTADVDPSPDQVEYREVFQTQRDSLLEKLVEYTVGTQSNTAIGVKRMSFRCLINIHILFCPSEKTTEDGTPLVAASLPLQMDDEIQYRCAGYIQAEIERYADEIHTDQHDQDDGSDKDEDDHTDEDDDEDVPATKKKKRTAKAKKTGSDGDSSAKHTSRGRLQREYAFMDVIYTFLRALNTGVIELRQSAMLLAHHGRLGPAFDACSKQVVEILREEGMFNKQGDVVVEVITQALQEAFTLVLDGIVRTEIYAIALAKSLNMCLVARGAQLAVVARLGGEFVVRIHTELLTWIGKKIAAYEKNKNKKARNTAIMFFRVLLPLLMVIPSGDALKIKAHMDQVLTDANVEISPSSKVWEPQRAYDKRLGTAVAKDKAPVSKGRKTKAAAAATTDEGESGMDDDQPDARPKAARTRPAAPRRARAAVKSAAVVADNSGDDDEFGQTTPKAKSGPKLKAKPKPKPKPVFKSKATIPSSAPARSSSPAPVPASPARSQTLSEPPDDAVMDVSDPVDNGSVNGFTTPKTNRKRRRDEVDDDDEEQQQSQDHAPSDPPSHDEEDQARIPTPAGTPAGDMIIRRKRIRY